MPAAKITVRALLTGTFCGVFRRQALDRGAASLGIDHIVTGHNADDMAETVLMNSACMLTVLRGDVARLERCTAIVTQGPDQENETEGCGSSAGGGANIRRSKPFKYAYEKEIVMYAYFKQLDYFSTECIYSPNAYRGYARSFLKDLESIRPSAIIDIIHSGERLHVNAQVPRAVQQTCTRCGYISSNALCKACVLLEALNRGQPALGVRSERSRAVKSQIGQGDVGRTIPRWTGVSREATRTAASADAW